jgi:hypothetical protein
VIDRRAVFFVIAAVAAALLVPVAEPEFRWVAIAVSVTYLLLAAASYLDARSRRRSDQ